VKLGRATAAVAARLGHDFARPELLVEALTHPSTASGHDNQRLEFLGDRVLGLVIAEALLDADRTATEGDLAPRLNALVRKEACAEVAAELDIGPALRMGRSEMLTGGRRKTALLGDAMEAVIAAVYLDAGLEPARALILRAWGARIGAVRAVARDPKTALQEWAQARGLPPPAYLDLDREGPDHAPLFSVEARLADGRAASGRAPSKRAAQQAAAETLLGLVEAPADTPDGAPS
jgi:ribonuclease-3